MQNPLLQLFAGEWTRNQGSGERSGDRRVLMAANGAKAFQMERFAPPKVHALLSYDLPDAMGLQYVYGDSFTLSPEPRIPPEVRRCCLALRGPRLPRNFSDQILPQSPGPW